MVPKVPLVLWVTMMKLQPKTMLSVSKPIFGTIGAKILLNNPIIV